MASLTNNPYKRMKKSLKGGKADGMVAHKMAQKSVKSMHKKVAVPKDINLGMAMKKATTVSMQGNKKRKGAPSVGQQPGARGLKEMKSSKKKLSC